MCCLGQHGHLLFWGGGGGGGTAELIFSAIFPIQASSIHCLPFAYSVNIWLVSTPLSWGDIKVNEIQMI